MHSKQDYCIGEGGLLRRFEVAAHLTRLHWQLLVLLGITWLPLVTIGLVSARPEALVYDPAVHVRLLVVVPLLLILDQLFPPLCRYTLAQIRDRGFVPETARPRLERRLQGAERASDSSIPEAILGLLALGLAVATLSGVVQVRGMVRTRLALDQVWYALTDLPLFHFLLWRSVWRWLIWLWILFGLSRINLDLVPTHPDRCGGIRILKLPSISYCALLQFALSSALCAEWEARATIGATLATFGPLLLVLAGGGIALALAPLCLLIPQLLEAKKRGIDELGGVATTFGRQFRAALNAGQPAPDRDYVHTLSSVEQTYRETVDQLRLLPFDKKDLIFMLVATVLPVVPTLLMHVPREDWWAITNLITGLPP